MTKGLVIAGLGGGSGKSVVSVGLTAALEGAGNRVQPFKKGPDYIDAGWLRCAAKKDCYNLDPYLMSSEQILDSFCYHSAGADLVVVEGNRGLYDGVTADGGYATADLAMLIDLPVLLVMNCIKTTRTIAAMVLGCQHFEPRLRIAGVILNHVATERQRLLVTEAIEKYTGVPVVGAIPRMKRDIFPMRHLGMIPWQEYQGSDAALDFLCDTVTTHVDLAAVQKIMAPVVCSKDQKECRLQGAPPDDRQKVRIGILQDAAFQFYYAENLEALEREGAELVFLDALKDKGLPELDGLYIGGGFPETSVAHLAGNEGFRRSVKEQAEKGLPIYAECGGLIYLGESLVMEGREYPLAGVFPARFAMAKRPQAHGYSRFTVREENPFYAQGTQVKGHEFRYSKVVEYRKEQGVRLVLQLDRGTGFCNGWDGLCFKNVLALYTHVHAGGTVSWASGLVARCRQFRSVQKG